MNSPEKHFVNGKPLVGPFESHLQQAVFGLGCFWGAERCFWQTEGVYTTAAGYAGGHQDTPSYQDVCSGNTGHAEVVLVIFDPSVISYVDLLKVFWENHDPTTLNRQGNDIGSQYRSLVLTTDATQGEIAKQSLAAYQQSLAAAGLGKITTTVGPLEQFHYAEDYHQQYLAKNPGGYCGLGGTGVSCA